MMTKRVLDVGNCALDHAAVCELIEGSFAAEVVQAHTAADALALLRREPFDLVLVNRRLDHDRSEGLAIIEAIKRDAQLAATPVMLISNYPQYQQRAVEAGADEGFGKSQLRRAETLEKLRRFLA